MTRRRTIEGWREGAEARLYVLSRDIRHARANQLARPECSTEIGRLIDQWLDLYLWAHDLLVCWDLELRAMKDRGKVTPP